MIKDKEIVAGCRADNPMSQKLLFERYSPVVMGIAIRYLQNFADAEDLVQETFIKIFLHIKDLRDSQQLDPWVRRIATHTILDFLRSRSACPEYLSLDGNTYDTADIQQTFSNHIDTEDLLKILQELPEKHRIVFNLCAIDGYSYEEVSRMLNCPQATVRSCYFRAKKILSEKLQ